MRKVFQIIGLISLTCFSFFITEQTATVVSDMDEIMIEIKANRANYKTKAIDALISDDTIIPGVRGRVVNINKSYKKMKISGYYSDKLYEYDYTNPKISLIDNLDKYIIKGNPSKRMISLIFTVEQNDDITQILNIINNYNIKVTFFVDSSWFSSNNNQIEEIIKKGHNIGLLTDNYNNPDFEWIDMVLKKVNNQNNGFCYNINQNQENLEYCVLKNNYTIKPIIISDNNPLVEIKQNAFAGNLLSLNINSKVKKELSTIIIYLKSKGFTITNLEENILE